MAQKTAESISAQLEVLATVTDEELAKATVKLLREKLSLLGVNTIDRAGEAIEVNSARKSELLKALQTLVSKQRALNKAIVPNDGELIPEVKGLSVNYVYERLEAMVDLTIAQSEQAVLVLANEVAKAIAIAYPDTDAQLRFNTRCNVRASLCRNVLEQVLQAQVNGLHTVFVNFREQLYKFTEADAELKRVTNTAKTEVKAQAAEAGNATPVHIQPMLDWATQVLDKAKENQLRKTAWKDVAIALGLVTGRRMYSELLYELGTFTATSAMQVTAHELAKGKAEVGEVSEIPEMTVLVDSSLVVAGKQWLIDNGKVQEATQPMTPFTKVTDRTKANQKYGSDLSKHYREFAVSFGLPESTTVHSLRKLYIAKAVQLVEGYRSKGKEAMRLLGHQRWDSANDNYNSEFTIV